MNARCFDVCVTTVKEIMPEDVAVILDRAYSDPEFAVCMVVSTIGDAPVTPESGSRCVDFEFSLMREESVYHRAASDAIEYIEFVMDGFKIKDISLYVTDDVGPVLDLEQVLEFLSDLEEDDG